MRNTPVQNIHPGSSKPRPVAEICQELTTSGLLSKAQKVPSPNWEKNDLKDVVCAAGTIRFQNICLFSPPYFLQQDAFWTGLSRSLCVHKRMGFYWLIYTYYPILKNKHVSKFWLENTKESS